MVNEVHPIYGQLLALIGEHRFATTHQLTRLTVQLYGSRKSAIRQTLRHLRELRSQHLVTKLERRVGGWQGGSQVAIWTLTTRGRRELTGSRGRLRPHHHSTTFSEHSLAVTEARVLLHESTTDLGLQLTAQSEPACWRHYLDPHGAPVALKPDLTAMVTSNEFVDRYFVEVDRATENPARVIRKCWQYVQYRRSGTEQDRYGVFPAVVWVVPNAKRHEQLTRYIREEKLPGEMFIVITPDQFKPLVRDGPPAT